MGQQHVRDLPIEFAGAGLWEALLLSATLRESSGLVAMLDEPARNLHPTLQRRLLAEIKAAPGQFILTTHSPYLVPVDAAGAAGIVRLDATKGVTRARHLRLAGAGASPLRKALAESTDARALLFARGVILVEGGTETGALPEWFAKSDTANRIGDPDALNLVVQSVDGDGGFQTYVALLNALHIPWGIVCDGFVYRFNQPTKQIFEQVLEAGYGNSDLRAAVAVAKTGGSQTFKELKSIGETSRIFTLAGGWTASDESIESYIEAIMPGLLARAGSVVGRSKPRRGRHVAAATACLPAVDQLYVKLLNCLGNFRGN
jgi:AAA domain, putative AbiEii toxin, Type IV TA system